MRVVAVSLTFACVFAGSCETLPGAGPEDGAWFTISAAGGEQIGFAHRQVSETRNGQLTTEVQEYLVAQKDGREHRISSSSTTRTGPGGELRSISTMTSTGRTWTRQEITYEDGRATVVRETPVKRTEVQVPVVQASGRGDNSTLLRAWDPLTSPVLEYERFDTSRQTTERVVMSPVEQAGGDETDTLSVWRWRYSGEQLIGVSRLRLNAERRVTEIVQPMFGTSVTIRRSTREAALAPHAPFRLTANAAQPSPYRISNAAIDGHIRYRFRFLDELEFPIPGTGEQAVEQTGGVALLDICPACGAGLPTDHTYLARAVEPTDWIQSDDPSILATVTRIVDPDASGIRKMEVFVRETRAAIEILDYAGHFSAAETLERGAGDCSEAAVLLAAMGRAAGIPTMVASGLVYSRLTPEGDANVFVPHSWTLAYVDGVWRSYDAALGSFDSTHIALTVGHGDDLSIAAARQLASLLVWDGMGQVRSSSLN